MDYGRSNRITLEEVEDMESSSHDWEFHQPAQNEDGSLVDSDELDPEAVTPLEYIGTFVEKQVPEDAELIPHSLRPDVNLKVSAENLIPEEDENHKYAHNIYGKPLVHVYFDQVIVPTFIQPNPEDYPDIGTPPEGYEESKRKEIEILFPGDVLFPDIPQNSKNETIIRVPKYPIFYDQYDDIAMFEQVDSRN